MPATAPDQYKLASSVVLSRPPVLTRDIPDFENAFYFYQRRLEERLALPFTRYFYFKNRTVALAEYKKRQARIQDRYNPYNMDGWKDELLVGDYRWKQPDFGYQKLLETTVSGDGVSESVEGDVLTKTVYKPSPRITEADRKNDTKSLDRKLPRTLYLLVKQKEQSPWKFPEADIVEEENLKEVSLHTHFFSKKTQPLLALFSFQPITSIGLTLTQPPRPL